MEPHVSPNRLTRAAGIVLCLGLLAAVAPPARAQQNKVINFAGTVDQSLSGGTSAPDGAPVDGTLFFADTNTVILSSTASQTIYTNATATVKFSVNGTNHIAQGFGASVSVGVSDLSGLSIPCDRLFINWRSGLTYGIIICSEVTNFANSAQIGITNSQWWANRLPYPIDHVVGVSDTLAPLTAYGPPPALTIIQTNGYEIISYPTAADGYTLESTTALTTNSLANWQAVTNAAVVNGANWNVIISNTPPIQFFRLGTLN